MKTKFLILAGLAILAMTPKVHAYSSADGVDPRNSTGNLAGDVETKQIVKTADAGESEALIAGLVVAYDASIADGYTVTRAVTQTIPGQRLLACVTVDSVATGDTNYHRCITKGFARVRYSGGVPFPITAGIPACVDAGGTVRGCNITNAEATLNTGIIPLQSKTDSGTDLGVLINLR